MQRPESYQRNISVVFVVRRALLPQICLDRENSQVFQMLTWLGYGVFLLVPQFQETKTEDVWIDTPNSRSKFQILLDLTGTDLLFIVPQIDWPRVLVSTLVLHDPFVPEVDNPRNAVQWRAVIMSGTILHFWRHLNSMFVDPWTSFMLQKSWDS